MILNSLEGARNETIIAGTRGVWNYKRYSVYNDSEPQRFRLAILDQYLLPSVAQYQGSSNITIAGMGSAAFSGATHHS